MKNYENKLPVASVRCTATTYLQVRGDGRIIKEDEKKNRKISSNGGGNAYKSTDGR